VNTSNNITESEENYWSRIEKSVLAPILTTEMVLGVLGNGLVLIVKIVVRIMYHFMFFIPSENVLKYNDLPHAFIYFIFCLLTV